MSINFYGSENSRYLVGLEGREIFLLRDYRDAWRRKIKYNNFEVVGVGNNGKTFVKADEGVIVYPLDPTEEEYIIPVFEKNILENENSTLVKVVMDRMGDRLCLEKVSLKSKLSEKIFRILASSSKKEKGQAVHQLIFYEIQTGKQTMFYRFVVDRKTPHAFSWSISPDFCFVIWGEAQKAFKGAETKFSVADVREESIFDQFVLEGISEWLLFINNFGSYLIDSPQRDEVREILVGNIDGENFKITISTEYKVLHLGKNYIAFTSRMEPGILFKRYDNSLIQEIDLSPLEEMDMEYQVIFNERDDIDFVVRKEGNVRVVHTNLDRFAIDAKRWQMMVEQKKIDAEIEKRKKALEEKQVSLKSKKSQIKTEELSRTAKESMESRQRQKYEAVEQKERELDDLKLLFMSNKIGKYDYVVKKKKMEEELEELRKRAGAEAEETPEFVAPETLGVPTKTRSLEELVTRNLQEKEPSFATMEGGAEKTRQLSLQEELKKYIPTVAEEKPRGTIKVEPPSRSVKKEVTFEPPKVQPRKKRMPERLDFEIKPRKREEPQVEKLTPLTAPEVTEPEPFEPVEEYTPEPYMEEPEVKKSLRKSVEITVKPQAGKMKPAKVRTKTHKLSVPHRVEKRQEAPATTKLEIDEEDTLKMSPPSHVMTEQDNERLLEIRRQIEREIQEAIHRKKKLPQHTEEQKKKYLKLLEELEESFKHGGISQDNYLRLKEKYENRIRKLEEEGE